MSNHFFLVNLATIIVRQLHVLVNTTWKVMFLLGNVCFTVYSARCIIERLHSLPEQNMHGPQTPRGPETPQVKPCVNWFVIIRLTAHLSGNVPDHSTIKPKSSGFEAFLNRMTTK